jgi:hypothetical protein
MEHKQPRHVSDSLWANIFSCLEFREQSKCERVSKRWLAVTKMPASWNAVCTVDPTKAPLEVRAKVLARPLRQLTLQVAHDSNSDWHVMHNDPTARSYQTLQVLRLQGPVQVTQNQGGGGSFWPLVLCRHFANLQEMHILDYHSDAAFSTGFLASLKSLRRLVVTDCDNRDSYHATPLCLEYFKVVYNNPNRPFRVAHLPRMPKLQKLVIEGAKEINVDGLEAKRLPALTDLEIDCPRLCARDLVYSGAVFRNLLHHSLKRLKIGTMCKFSLAPKKDALCIFCSCTWSWAHGRKDGGIASHH